MPLYDLSHNFGSDLQTSASGDLLTVTGDVATKQRILRRLLTSISAYIFELNYGAGLGSFIGTPAKPANIEAVIRQQILLEPSVASTPIPQITLPQSSDPSTVVFTIQYTDAQTGQTVVLSYPS